MRIKVLLVCITIIAVLAIVVPAIFMPEHLRVALIGLGGTAIGALIGGFMTYWATSRTLEQQREALVETLLSEYDRLHAERRLIVYQQFSRALFRRFDELPKGRSPLHSLADVNMEFRWAYPFLDKVVIDAYRDNVFPLMDQPDLTYERLQAELDKVYENVRNAIEAIREGGPHGEVSV